MSEDLVKTYLKFIRIIWNTLYIWGLYEITPTFASEVRLRYRNQAMDDVKDINTDKIITRSNKSSWITGERKINR